MVVFKCTWCGEHLSEPGDLRQPRSDKRFCCAAHRVKYHRWQKRVEKYEADASKAIKALAEYLQHPIAQPRAAASLVRVSELIKYEARANGLRQVR